MTTIKQLEPHTEHTPGVTARLHFRRDFGSFQQQRPQPQRLPEATRAYQYGDPLRSIDWRAYARTDQLLVNQQHQTASADVLIAVSCHPSMQWPPADLHPDASAKLEIALRVALHLTFMHVKILDRVTLYLVATEVQQIKFTDATAVLDIYASMRNVDFSYPQITHCAAFTAAATPDLRQLRGDAKYWLGDGLHTAEQDFLTQQHAATFCIRCPLLSLKATGLTMTVAILNNHARC